MLIRLYAFFFICCLGSFCLPDLAAQCTISTTASPATCLLTDGSIAVQVAGGIPNYAYNWNNGITTGNGNNLPSSSFTIDNLTTGSYGLTVTDGGGCTATSTITVLQQPTDTTLLSNVTCNPNQVGITQDLLSNVHGCDSLVITITTLVQSSITNLTVSTCNPADVGTFTQVLTNQFGCDSTVTTVVVFDPNACTAALGDFVWNDLDGDGIQDAGEPGIPGATVTLTGTTGSGNPVTLSTTTGPIGEYLFPNLSPGIYTVTFTTPVGYTPSSQNQGGNDASDSDANPATGQSQTEILVAGESNLTYDAGFINIQLNTLVTNVSCSSTTNGAIDLVVTNGTAPFTYSWSNGVITEDLNGLTAGTYSVTVMDATGLTVTATAVVQQLSLQVAVSNLACLGGNLGSLQLSVTGGTAPYNYVLNGAVTQTGSSQTAVFNVTNISAGNYSIVITDAGGCTATNTVVVPVSVTPIELTMIVTPIACFGESNGDIILTVTGGTAPYTYSWSNGQTTEDVSGLTTGIYQVTVTDANGCPKTADAVVAGPNALVLTTTSTNATCGLANGSINLTINGGVPPYIYLSSNGTTTEDLTNLVAGIYCITVTDASGCTATTCATVNQLPGITLQTVINPSSCLGNGSITVNISGGTPNYSYTWSGNNSTGSGSGIVAEPFTISNLGGGTYSITVTDGRGCTAVTLATINPSSPITAVPTVTYTNCASATVSIQVTDDNGSYLYDWGGTGPFAVYQNSGTYYVTVTAATGCTAVANFTIDLAANSLCGAIEGRVVRDTIENCQTDAEPGLANWIVQAVGVNTYYGLTDSVGNYHIGVEPGTYALSAVLPNALWEPCPLSPTITLSQSSDTVIAADLLVQKNATCPALTVSIAAGQLRRCFTGFYTVDYCNDGTAPAENAYLLVQLDAYLAAQSATIFYTNLGNGQLRFDLGHLDVGECGSFKIYVNVSCNATPGQTHCTEAHIYPDMPCLPNNPLWSGASLQIQSVCNADSLHFVIKNVGTGDLGETVNYIVIEDQVMLMQAPVPHLLAGESVEVAFPANGSTWRMEVQQASFHPGVSQPALSVEGCSTGTFTTGFVSQFPADDADPWLDIDCTVNTGSYDPNDKQGFPVGYGSAHYVRPGTDIEYKIRFQNTGTDTALNVVVVDTLSAWLDPATFHPGPASHPYRVELYGTGILKFHFENILLPDSNVNEVASHGFLQFRISPRSDAPLETVIENQAQIYFDFNDPVLTNTTFHRLGEQFVTTSLWHPRVIGATISVSPNPFDQQARLEVKGMATNAPLYLEVFDLQGNRVSQMASNDAIFLLRKGNWPTGVYLFRISQKGKLVGSGKLIVQ